MGDENQKEYFDKKIQEQCGTMRLLALQVADLGLQLEAMKAQHANLLQVYMARQGELKQTVDLAHRMLGLKGEWICAIDKGVLVPVAQPPAKEATPEES